MRGYERVCGGVRRALRRVVSSSHLPHSVTAGDMKDMVECRKRMGEW